MIEASKEFLLPRVDACYPPHHTGLHLEEYFVERFLSEKQNTKRKLIPVHWTAVYNHRVKEGLGGSTPNGKLRNSLQEYLNSLDPQDEYFIVCTHDDAPSEKLPPNTKVFAAGGNSSKIDVCIPLTCGPHQNINDKLKTVPISFVGSVTHNIRYKLLNEINQKPGVFINAINWSENIAEDKVKLFKEVTEASIFSLCPRGYGATSYRLYEAMQLGAIPVYVSDKHLLPWSDEINWQDFCVVVEEKDIPGIREKLLNFSSTNVRKMQTALLTVWKNHFSIESSYKHIVKRI